MQRRTSLLLALAAFTALPQAALAEDSFLSTRSELLVEKGNDIELSIDHGHAELTVRRTLFNGGPKHDQALFFLDIPDGSVATGLRTQGIQNGQPIWFKGDLLEAEAAAAKYKELTGIGGYYPKDPALLSWRSQGLLALQVFPVEPNKQKVVEYTLHMPTDYIEGLDQIHLRKMGTDKLSAQLVVRTTSTEDTLLINGKTVSSGTHVALDKEEGVTIALRRAFPQRFDGLFAMVPFAKERVLSRFRIELAEKISQIPKNARIAVLLDASRSLDERELAAEKAAAAAYLSHFSDAQVQVISFNRRVHERFSGFTGAAQVLKDWGNFKLEPENGSAVDDALAKADALLAKAPPNAPKRIVLFTDLRTRQEITPERARARLSKSGALLHIGIIQAGFVSLERQDEHPWMSVVKPMGGMVWNASASADQGDAEVMRGAYEELARPLRVDHFQVNAPGLAKEDFAFLPETLNEGEAFEDARIAKKQIPWVEMRGQMWSMPVKRTIVPDEREAKLWSALVFGSSLLHELTEEEMMPLAMRGGAVSPVTSYLAIEPGVRPSTEGLDEGESFGAGGIGLSGVGEGGGGRGEGIGLGSIDLNGFLKKEFQARWTACKGKGHVSVHLQTTLSEIADVRVSVSEKQKTAQSCMEEAVWAFALPRTFSAEWEAFDVVL